MQYGEVRTDKGFFIGDISYVTRASVYDDVWGRKYQYEDGIFSAPIHANSKNEYTFAAVTPVGGEGDYFDVDGLFRFNLKCCMGIVPWELMKVSLQRKPELVDGLFVKAKGIAKVRLFKSGEFNVILPKECDYPHHRNILVSTVEVNDYIPYEDDEDDLENSY